MKAIKQFEGGESLKPIAKTTRLEIRLRPAEKQKLAQLAQQTHMSMSRYVRWLVRNQKLSERN